MGTLEGTTVGRYMVGGLLGRGGMGEVFLGSDPVLQRQVVIKRLHPSHDPQSHRAERLRHEAQLQSRLTHQNIVRVYDYVSVDETDYIVSEYIDGGTPQTPTLAAMLVHQLPAQLTSPMQAALGLGLRPLIASLADSIAWYRALGYC